MPGNDWAIMAQKHLKGWSETSCKGYIELHGLYLVSLWYPLATLIMWILSIFSAAPSHQNSRHVGIDTSDVCRDWYQTYVGLMHQTYVGIDTWFVGLIPQTYVGIDTTLMWGLIPQTYVGIDTSDLYRDWYLTYVGIDTSLMWGLIPQTYVGIDTLLMWGLIPQTYVRIDTSLMWGLIPQTYVGIDTSDLCEDWYLRLMWGLIPQTYVGGGGQNLRV